MNGDGHMQLISLLPHKTLSKLSNFTVSYLKTTPFHELCTRYNHFVLHNHSSSVALHKKELNTVLTQLSELGYVYAYIDQRSSHELFALNEKMDLDSTPVPVNIESHKAECEPEIESESESDKQIHFKLKVAQKYANLMKNAVQRNLEFNLELSDIEMLLKQERCFYTGKLFDDKTNIRTVDRIKSDKGYVKGNVVASTWDANQLKNSLLELSNPLFTDIESLKRFVDIMYIGLTEKDPLHALTIFK